jgi:dihydrofolate reductase
MGEVVLQMGISVDGFVADADGGLDWMFPTIDPELGEAILAELWRAGVHGMGRRTYEDMSAAWPESSAVYAQPMNEIPKVVFSHGDVQTSWGPVSTAGPDLAAELDRLRREVDGNVLIHGGAVFAREVVAAGVLDRLSLRVHPVAIGRGQPIFSALSDPLRLELAEARTFPDGVIVQDYRPAQR